MQLSDGATVRALYLVGCDGGRSLVRKAAGIDFPGSDPTTSNIVAEVEMTQTPPLGMQRAARHYGFGRLDYEIVEGKIVFMDEGPMRVMVHRTAGRDRRADAGRPAEILIAVSGTDYGIARPD